MTATPESWDDMGSLRLKVDSISQRVEDVHKGQHMQAASHGLNISQLLAVTQELKAEVASMHAQEKQQKKEVARMKVCLIITLVLFACVLGEQTFMLYSGSTQWSMIHHPEDLHRPQSDRVSHETDGVSDEEWKTHLDDHKASDVITLLPARQIELTKGVPSQDNHRSSRFGLQVEQKSVISDVAKRKMEKELLAERTHWTEDQTTATEAKKKNSSVGEAKKKPGTSWNVVEKKTLEAKQTPEPEVLQSLIDSEGRAEVGVKSAQEDPVDARQDAKDAEDKAFQMLTPETSPQLMKRARDGVFWVCFPPNSLEEFVNKYASVFNEVARSHKWWMYSFCYLDTQRLQVMYTDHFCDDVEQITFVLTKDVESESPAWFKRTFQPDQEIQASLVDQFLDDIHSGALLGIKEIKGDL